MKLLIGIVIGTIISGGSVYAATILFASNQVSYNNSSSGLSSTNVQAALDELNTKVNASAKSVKTVSVPNNTINAYSFAYYVTYSSSCAFQSGSSSYYYYCCSTAIPTWDASQNKLKLTGSWTSATSGKICDPAYSSTTSGSCTKYGDYFLYVGSTYHCVSENDGTFFRRSYKAMYLYYYG